MKKMLLIVDPQNDFINGALPVAGADEAMRALAGHLANHGQEYRYIAVTCDSHPAGHCSFKENGGEWPAHCVSGSEGERIWAPLAQALQGLDMEVLHKGDDPECEEYSIFRNPHGRMRLMELAEKKHIDSIDICGIAGDYCVLQTLKDGMEIFGAERFNVLKSCIASIDGGKALDEYLAGLEK